MSDEQRDAAVIAAAREVIKGYESEGLPGQYVGTGIGLRMTHQFNLAALRLAALRTIDRLTAERDAARRDLNAIFELTITDVMASYDPEQIVHHVSILRNERDAARAEVERLRAACAGISEGLIRTATHGVENLTKRDWLIQTAQNITAALKSEVSK